MGAAVGEQLKQTVEAVSQAVKAALSRYPCEGERWLAYSGGLDSTVLLHLLTALEIPLRAIHIHHGLSPNADRWQTHCEEVAAAHGVPLVAERVAVDPSDGGLEQAARRARYRIFEQYLQPGDQLLLAQHGDDQVETFFLRLLRGAGTLGLAAMAQQRRLGQGSLLRPLLGVARTELEGYAHARGLHWVEDESNRDERLDRNYLRASVLPLLQARWPLRQRVARAANNLRESAELLEELGRDDLQHCSRRSERFGESVSLKALLQLSPVRQKNLLRVWVGICGGDMPEAPRLTEALAQARDAARDSDMAVVLGGPVLGLVVRRFRDRLYLTPQLAPELSQPGRDGEEPWELEWDGRAPLALPGGWLLEVGADWPPGHYRVCNRRGGERARPRGRDRSQTLKKLLQEYALEPWLRDAVPLVYRGASLLAAGDLFLCEAQVGSLRWRYGGGCGQSVDAD